MKQLQQTVTKRKNHQATVILLCLTTLMSTIDTSIVTIGLPTIAGQLHADFPTVQWIMLSYMLALTSLIVGIGRIADIFGKKRLYAIGILLFIISSVLCGISTSVVQLIIFRTIQGIGGAILITLSFALAGDVLPKDKLENGMAAITAMLPIGFAIGPSVGGLLITWTGWRTIFFLNLPLGLVALLLFRYLPVLPIPTRGQALDLKGMLLLSFSLICYVLSITLAEKKGPCFGVLCLVIAAVAGIILFIHQEKTAKEPLIQLNVFHNIIFSASLGISVILYLVINGYGFIMPYYLEQAKGLTAAAAGSLMMAGPVGCAVLTPVSSIMSKRIGNIKVMELGMLMLVIGMIALSSLAEGTSLPLIVIELFFTNGSLAFFQTPNNAFIMSMAKPGQRGVISGLLNLSRTMGQASGTTIIGAFFFLFAQTPSIHTAPSENIVAGIHGAFIIAAGFAAGAFFLGLFAYNTKGKSKSIR
ncbi:MAG: MFS transporter [Spirochaetia bacterium]|nr:MFS transporter [Spirochaetia bacterium]